MKTDAWSLAFLAGGALVAADGWDNWSSSESSVASTTSSATPVSSATKSESTSTPVQSATPSSSAVQSSSTYVNTWSETLSSSTYVNTWSETLSSSSVLSTSSSASVSTASAEQSSSAATWAQWSSVATASSSAVASSSTHSTAESSAVASSSTVHSSGVSSSSVYSTGSAKQSSSAGNQGWGQWTSTSAFSTGASSSTLSGSGKPSTSSVYSSGKASSSTASGSAKQSSTYSTGKISQSKSESSSTSATETWSEWNQGASSTWTPEYKPTTPVVQPTTPVQKPTTPATTPTGPVGPNTPVTMPTQRASSAETWAAWSSASGVCQSVETTVISGTTMTRSYISTATITTTITSTVTGGANTPVAPVSTIYVAPVPVASTTVTQVTTTYTTVVTKTATGANGQPTVVTGTSTVTGALLSTIIYGPTASETGPAPISVVPWGSNTFTYAVTKSIDFPVIPTAPAATWGPWPIDGGNGGNGGASGTAHHSGHRSGTAVSGHGKPTGTGAHRPSGTKSAIPTPSVCVPCEGQPGSDPDNFCGYTINDNSYKVTPKTCKTVEYDFVITNTTFAPDGIERIGLLINGQFPGPLIEANWGDTIIVHVHNQMQFNGTSIHFHGQRQLGTNEMDGVASITQCPLAPGQSQTYTFTADNYGSSWYHSHFSLQIQDGVQGPMIIHGPAAAEYDGEDFLVITDWNHVSLNELYDISEDAVNPAGGPPTLDTGLINGLNVWPPTDPSNPNVPQGGSRYQINVESGKKYRLRLVNSGAQTSFKFYIDQHTFQVIAADFVPIVPYTTNIINLNCGQRYDIVFVADQPVANYWARADGQNICIALKNPTDIKAIVHYEGADNSLPTSTAYGYQPICEDEPLASLVPIVTLPAGQQSTTFDETVLIGGNSANLYRWSLSGTSFVSQWDNPTLGSIVNEGKVPDYSSSLALSVPNLGEWVYIIIESPIPVPHPIHLHGHDFAILAQGYGPYNSSVPLNVVSPARRDTALMPSDRGTAGYLVIAFEADNPGTWLLHCHIIWHAAMGLALQVIEAIDQIPTANNYGADQNAICDNWHSWDLQNNYDITDTDDSGI